MLLSRHVRADTRSYHPYPFTTATKHHKSTTHAYRLVERIIHTTHTQDLRLGRNRLGEPGVRDLSVGLSRSSTLLRLDLSGNALNTAAAEALGRALCPPPTSANTDNHHGGVQTGPPPLEFLDVSRNPLGDEGGAVLFRALATGRGASATLRGLSVAEAGLGIGAAAALAGALVPPTVAQGDALAEKACEILSQEVVGDVEVDRQQRKGDDGKGPRTAEKHTASTGGGGGGSSTESSAAPGLLLLKSLDVSKNEMGACGAADLARALSGGGAPGLKSLSIGYNELGDDGAAAIGRAAGAGSASMKVLDLSGNGLSGAGIGAVLSARGLREAKLFHNACGDEGAVSGLFVWIVLCRDKGLVP